MTRSGARLLLASTAASCVAFLLFLPRPIEPREAPALVLDESASAAAIARDQRVEGRGASAERARAADRGERALREALSRGSERSGRDVLAESYGLVRGGRTVAPRVVVRAFEKARWNDAHGLPTTEGFAPVERRAYFGWLALEAPRVPAELREEALVAYAEAGGQGGEEALALFHAIHGHHGDAFIRYAALFEASGEIRYRNHARWAAAALE